MAQKTEGINLEELSSALREARERKGWTLDQLSHELWDRGLPTAQNKLWRLENNPPKRLDTELLLWLEKLLDVHLLPNKNQVLLQDVLDLIDRFIDSPSSTPEEPECGAMHEIYEKLVHMRSA